MLTKKFPESGVDPKSAIKVTGANKYIRVQALKKARIPISG